MHTDVSQLGTQPLICDLLYRWKVTGALPTPELARIWHLADNSVYRYYQGTEPTYTQIAMLFERVNVDLQRELLSTLTAGQGWVFNSTNDELDVNGDGRIDISDAIQLAINDGDRWPKMLQDLFGSIDSMDDDKLNESLVHLRRVTRTGLSIERIIMAVLQHRQRRKLRTAGVAGRGA